MMEGYVIIHKKLLEWQYYKSTDMVRMFLHLLLVADEEGVVTTTIASLSNDTGLSVKVVRNCIEKMEKGKMLGKKRANKNTHLTICDYETYKTTKRAVGQKKGKMLGKQNEGELDKRKKLFTEHLRPFVNTYGRDMVNDFWKYWTEPNKSRTKMRFELQKTWDTQLRLETWANNELKRNGSNRKNHETKEQRAERFTERIYKLLAEDESEDSCEEEDEC